MVKLAGGRCRRRHYRQIPALREIALVSQHEPRVEVWRCRDGEWTPVPKDAASAEAALAA